MRYPSIDKLVQIIDSKYKLVHIVSKRSKEIYETKQLQKSEDEYFHKKGLGKALEEVSEGLIKED